MKRSIIDDCTLQLALPLLYRLRVGCGVYTELCSGRVVPVDGRSGCFGDKTSKRGAKATGICARGTGAPPDLQPALGDAALQCWLKERSKKLFAVKRSARLGKRNTGERGCGYRQHGCVGAAMRSLSNIVACGIGGKSLACAAYARRCFAHVSCTPDTCSRLSRAGGNKATFASSARLQDRL